MAVSELRGRQGPEFGIVHRSPQMAAVLATVRRIAASEANVLILGESGTGKELIARAIHSLSPRTQGPFCDVHLAAIPEPLVESELFGRVRGAFTGANEDREGLFVSANGGTLFLDEIGEVPLLAQVKLLRALETRRVAPIGSTKSIPFDARLICATNKDLPKLVADGAFREDLFYRIDVVTVGIPPLREREGDIPLLIEHFLREFSMGLSAPPTLSYDALRTLCTYDWPGNVRQLRNAIEKLVVLFGEDTEVGLSEVERSLRLGGSRGIGNQNGARVADSLNVGPTTSDRADWARFCHHWRVFETSGWNISATARRLGIARNTFKCQIRRWTDSGWVVKVDGSWQVVDQ